MKILTGKDIRRADLYTMEHEPVTGIALMERAAVALEAEIVAAAETQESRKPAAEMLESLKAASGMQKQAVLQPGGVPQKADVPEYLVIAGKGNNGGDGLAVARLVYDRFGGSRSISVLLTTPPGELSEDCRLNLDRLPEGVRRFSLADGRIISGSGEVQPELLFRPNSVVVDAVLGYGVTGAARDAALEVIRLINGHAHSCRMVVSIDLPSGLPAEPHSGPGSTIPSDVVRADLTLTIEFPKLSLLLPATGKFAGRLRTVPIGLDRSFIESCASPFSAVDAEFVRTLLKPRQEFDHKGTHGHALIIAGSAEYMGAAILCAGAALRSGCGLVTAHIPSEGRTAMLVSYPSAIISADPSPVFSSLPERFSKYSSVAAGPGLGKAEPSVAALKELLACLPQYENIRALVLDADALNIISEHPGMLAAIPAGSVLTPHPGELARLLRAAADCGMIENAAPAAGTPWTDDMHRVALVRQLCRSLKSVIVVKGAHTMTCSPDGRCFFNMSGNPGMAKGGSGDVLTGLIAGLAARGYDPLTAALLGVWFHGCAGDDAAASRGVESMNAADILENIRI